MGGGPASGHPPRVVLRAEGQPRLVGMGANDVGEVGVGLDAARRHDQAGGVEHPGAVRRERARERDGDDPLAGDADLPGPGAVGRDHLAAPDHEIERHAARLPPPPGAVNDGRLARRPSRRAAFAPSVRAARDSGTDVRCTTAALSP